MILSQALEEGYNLKEDFNDEGSSESSEVSSEDFHSNGTCKNESLAKIPDIADHEKSLGVFSLCGAPITFLNEEKAQKLSIELLMEGTEEFSKGKSLRWLGIAPSRFNLRKLRAGKYFYSKNTITRIKRKWQSQRAK
jgi:hypothetical protein